MGLDDKLLTVVLGPDTELEEVASMSPSSMGSRPCCGDKLPNLGDSGMECSRNLRIVFMHVSNTTSLSKGCASSVLHVRVSMIGDKMIVWRAMSYQMPDALRFHLCHGTELP
jgi:hypothetical protein